MKINYDLYVIHITNRPSHTVPGMEPVSEFKPVFSDEQLTSDEAVKIVMASCDWYSPLYHALSIAGPWQMEFEDGEPRYVGPAKQGSTADDDGTTEEVRSGDGPGSS